MDKEELRVRFKNFALRIIRLVDEMPRTRSSNAIANQLIRSGTSPSANYRAACLGKSDRDFLNKLKMVEEELDETLHWIELVMESNIVDPNKLYSLHDECLQLLKIITKTIITQRNKINNSINTRLQS